MTKKEKQKSIEKYKDRLDEYEYRVISVKDKNSFLVDTKEGQRKTITFIK